ncbi:hypothetical protein ASE04_28405 [Rhizobium sp. Root708]|uniref:hypothetical protein n=1 Tax=Rhizobium sp. Root708 TaxID=1736592 RepID=UPI0006FEA1A5|nr:hypothetical protein [Rhizobium sp. Root708]KRB57100.1 hypothetical protein ASE04_28405 [Rhizobium sp. Root708]
MLIVLVIAAVILSLVAELGLNFLDARTDANWMRSDVSEHRAIVRAVGKVAFKPIKFSERQMNEPFNVASDRAW